MKTKEIALLMALQENARAGLKELARRSQMPLSTAHERLKKLERDGTIKNYAAVLDGDKVGVPVVAYVLVRLLGRAAHNSKSVTIRQLAERIAAMPRVQEAHMITGEWDLLLKVRAPSMRSVGKFVLDELREMPGVERTLSFESVTPIKESSLIDLSYSDESLNGAGKKWHTRKK